MRKKIEEVIAENPYIVATCIFLISFAVLVFFIIWGENNFQKDLNATEPLAIQICEERNLYYYSHTTNYVQCVDDPRTTDWEKYSFTEEEIENLTGEVE